MAGDTGASGPFRLPDTLTVMETRFAHLMAPGNEAAIADVIRDAAGIKRAR